MSKKQKISQSEIDGVKYRRAKLWQIILTAFNALVGMSVYSLIGMASYSASIGYGVSTAVVGIILTCTRVLDDLYEINGLKISEQIEQAKTKIDGRKPTVLFIRAAASTVKIKGSEGTVGGEILADLDTVNIADSGSFLEDLSIEAIVMSNPEYIFVTIHGLDTEAALANVEELLTGNPAWNSLLAVKNGNYYIIDKSLYNAKPNARWGEAYEYLADILYTEK